MEVWKEKPKWFDLKNYEPLYNFTPYQWWQEIAVRSLYIDSRLKPGNPVHKVSHDEKKQGYVDLVKTRGLIVEHIDNDIEILPSDDPLTLYLRDRIRNSNEVIWPTTQRKVYEFLFYSQNKDEIEKDLLKRDKFFDNHLFDPKQRLEHIDFIKKYDQPINEVEDSENLYLTIDMEATDEQLIDAFKSWLMNERSKTALHLKRKFTQKVLRSWYESMAIPYWDLVTIAKLEGAVIPNHVLGSILFPSTYDVDVSERVRKVTKIKSEYIFNWNVMEALKRQVNSEGV